jgi:hypothetical protein
MWTTSHDEIRRLALRLIAGETIDCIDEWGRHWRGTADQLSLIQPGTGAVTPVLFADAFVVAVRLAAASTCDVAVGSHRAPR